MPIKKDVDYVIKEFNNRDFTLLDFNYINSKTPMKCVDKYGYYYDLSLDLIKDKRNKNFSIVSKNNPYSIENIKTFIKNNNSNSILLSDKYLGNKEKLHLKCECGNDFYICWNRMKTTKKFNCNKCGRRRMAMINKKSVDEVENVLKSKGYKLISDFDNRHNISIEDEYGYKYDTSYYNIKNGNTKLYKFSKNNPYTIDNICLYIKLNNIPTELVDKTNRSFSVKKDYLEFYCSNCGKIFKANLEEVLFYGRYRCNKCTKSKSNLEYIVENYLIEKNIKYIYQKTFENCKNKRKLPFDFYLIDYNCVIEVNGQQHYYENKTFNQTLSERKRIDKIKKDYCNMNNIKYLEIPFWYIKNNGTIKNNFKEMIDNILNQ